MNSHVVNISDDQSVRFDGVQPAITIVDTRTHEQIILTIANSIKVRAAILTCLRHAGASEHAPESEQGWTFGDGKQKFGSYREAMDAMYATNDTGITRRGLRVWGLP